MDMNTLKEIGMSDGEAKIYLALLKIGDATRGDIVRESGVASSKIYEILDKLQRKGLASVYLKNNIKHFKPVNPNQILTYINEKKEKLNEVEADVNKILPELMMSFTGSKKNQEVEILSGFKGLQEIFREQMDAMKEGETTYVIGGINQGNEDNNSIYGFFRGVHIERTEKKIKSKLLYNKVEMEKMKRLYPKTDFPYREIKFVETVTPVAINIYHDITFMLIFSEELSIIKIKSQQVANSFIDYFNLLWEQSN